MGKADEYGWGRVEMSYTTKLYQPVQAEQAWREIFPKVKAYLTAGNRLDLTIKKETRSNEQNRLMWAALTDIANQVEWYGQKLSADDWKTMLTASLRKQRAVQGIDGGFVVLGLSTSKMTVAEMSELLELAIAFGADRGVKFND
jgi:hypothetical protein